MNVQNWTEGKKISFNWNPWHCNKRNFVFISLFVCEKNFLMFALMVIEICLICQKKEANNAFDHFFCYSSILCWNCVDCNLNFFFPICVEVSVCVCVCEKKKKQNHWNFFVCGICTNFLLFHQGSLKGLWVIGKKITDKIKAENNLTHPGNGFACLAYENNKILKKWEELFFKLKQKIFPTKKMKNVLFKLLQL